MPRLFDTAHTFIYAIGAPDGPQKIGHARSPASRLQNFTTGNDRDPKVGFQYAVPRADVFAIERLLHHRLRDRHVRGEWFSLTPKGAEEAIRRGIAAYKRGERFPPPKAPVSLKEPREPMNCRSTVELPAAFVEKVNDWRRRQPEIPSMSEAIRRLCDGTVDADASL